MDFSEVIKYGELIDKLVETISGYCKNINKKAILPDELNPKIKERIITSFTRKKENDCWAKGEPVDDLDDGLLLSNLIIEVSSSTVRDQLISFFKDQGISYKDNEVITFKGLMNFYANAASFITSKIILIGNSFYGSHSKESDIFGEKEMINSTWAIPLYNKESVTYQNTPAKWKKEENFNPIRGKYSYQNIKEDITLLTKSMINPQGIKFVKTNITFGCCSSSSSSSCSSCSSSSSLFIAYMEI